MRFLALPLLKHKNIICENALLVTLAVEKIIIIIIFFNDLKAKVGGIGFWYSMMAQISIQQC